MYGISFGYRHAIADAADSTIFAMRNPLASTRVVWIMRICLTLGFDGVTVLAQLGLGFRRFLGADPTGGASPTREKYYSFDMPSSAVLDANVKDAGLAGGVILTMAGATFSGYMHKIEVPAVAGTVLSHVLDIPRDGLRLDPGQGIAIGNWIVAIAGQAGSGSVLYEETSK